ncbi:MAG: hypothetical protein JW821_02510, partial [Deltaproteobacteria bacterium]|nr:hypothetical protein [Deltaproteobacteria bacterium]
VRLGVCSSTARACVRVSREHTTGASLNSSPSPTKVYVMKALGLSLAFLFLCGCAALTPLRGSPLTDQQATTVLERILEQDRRVSTFYNVGQLSVGKWYGETDTDILIVGSRDPFRVKIEITHSWGQPILHVLVRQRRLEVLSFGERRVYAGAFTPEALSRFFPCEFTPDLAWAVLRGFPTLILHHGFRSRSPDQVSLLDAGKREVEVIEIEPETLLPSRVRFPDQGIQVAFSEFQESDGIAYAAEVKVHQVGEGRKVTLRSKKMVFNRNLPDQIFVLERPPGFEVHDLDSAS